MSRRTWHWLGRRAVPCRPVPGPELEGPNGDDRRATVRYTYRAAECAFGSLGGAMLMLTPFDVKTATSRTPAVSCRQSPTVSGSAPRPG